MPDTAAELDQLTPSPELPERALALGAGEAGRLAGTA